MDTLAPLDAHAHLDPDRTSSELAERAAIDGARHLLARRPISSGEEITYDYIINCHGGEVWECTCGSERCRGTVPP
jgi:hypothetical protein